MSKAMRRSLIGTAIVVAMAVILSIPRMPEGQVCQKDEQTAKENCTGHHMPMLFLLEGGRFLDEHGVGVAAIATCVIAAFTVTLWFSTEKLWRAGENQRQDSERTARRQLRAYLSMEAGTAVGISHEDDPGHTVFECAPSVVNTGLTPAYNVRRRSWADIPLCPPVGPVPPLNFRFDLPTDANGSMVLGRDQRVSLAARPLTRPSNEWAEKIKTMQLRILLTWGEVTYDDVFGGHHWLRYSIVYAWNADGHVNGIFTDRHNDADRNGEPMPDTA